MTEPKDPERLLADALRAQAVFAPHTSSTPESETSGTSGVPGPATESTASTDELPPRYGLLSGAGADSLARERAALDNAPAGRTTPVTTDAPTVRTASGPAPLPALWVLLLALLLGLAAGSVIGLLTLV